jgi:hypothetical protein
VNLLDDTNWNYINIMDDILLDDMLDSLGQTAVSEEPGDYYDKYGSIGEYGDEGEQWEREASLF